ncbi:enolase-like isoform X2 [Periplaneta americana]|uniref:enolase-like isoform X2 n=1 Tax=Periplaneta americana TaxID=6978 RepID=UPI0037E99B12
MFFCAISSNYVTVNSLTTHVIVDLITDQGLFRAGVPSGKSTGIHEAVELRDGDKCRYMGKDVSKAIHNVNKIIIPELLKKNFEASQQKEIDDFLIDLDGTPNKSKLGANAILGVSLAVCKAGAAKRCIPLYRHIGDLAGIRDLIMPVPCFNVINGGSHAGNKLAIQEFMILPTGASSFQEAMKMGTEVYHHLKSIIKAKYGLDATAVGDEGGFAPGIQDAKDGFALLLHAIEKAGYKGKVDIAVDCAASEFFRDGKYDLDFKNPNSDKSKWLNAQQMTALYMDFVKKFNLVFIEDPFEQDDWNAWTNMTAQTDLEIIGDDLLVTNPARIQKAINRKACNSLLLKVNQIGTVTEAINAHNLAKQNGWGTLVSHRSGETEDTFISDLVVGLSTGHIKTGAPCRSERLAKYNQLLRIEEELGKDAKYAGRKFRKPL